MSTNLIGPHLTVILTKMFEAVGEEYAPEKVAEIGWYMDRSWTREQEDAFGVWMVDYLYRNHKDARAEFGGVRQNKPLLKKQVKYFLFNYGWMIKEEK
jgi:hypothetical protein